MDEIPVVYPVDLKERVFAAEGPITLVGLQIKDIPGLEGKYLIGSISDRTLPEISIGDVIAPVIPVQSITTRKALEQIENNYPIVSLYAAKGPSKDMKLQFYRYSAETSGKAERDLWQLHPGIVNEMRRHSFFPGRTVDSVTRGRLRVAEEEFKKRYRTFASVLE